MAACEKCGKHGTIYGAAAGWRMGVWCAEHLPPKQPRWLQLLKIFGAAAALGVAAWWLWRRFSA